MGRGMFKTMLFYENSYVNTITAGYTRTAFVAEYEPIENGQPIMTMDEFDQVLLRFKYPKRDERR